MWYEVIGSLKFGTWTLFNSCNAEEIYTSKHAFVTGSYHFERIFI